MLEAIRSFFPNGGFIFVTGMAYEEMLADTDFVSIWTTVPKEKMIFEGYLGSFEMDNAKYHLYTDNYASHEPIKGCYVFGTGSEEEVKSWVLGTDPGHTCIFRY